MLNKKQLLFSNLIWTWFENIQLPKIKQSNVYSCQNVILWQQHVNCPPILYTYYRIQGYKVGTLLLWDEAARWSCLVLCCPHYKQAFIKCIYVGNEHNTTNVTGPTDTAQWACIRKKWDKAQDLFDSKSTLVQILRCLRTHLGQRNCQWVHMWTLQ